MEGCSASVAVEVSNKCTLKRTMYMLTPIRCYDENEDLFAEALAKDLRKPRQEAVMFEVTNSILCTVPTFDIKMKISLKIVYRLNS